jgi:hypothetical protein
MGAWTCVSSPQPCRDASRESATSTGYVTIACSAPGGAARPTGSHHLIDGLLAVLVRALVVRVDLVLHEGRINLTVDLVVGRGTLR